MTLQKHEQIIFSHHINQSGQSQEVHVFMLSEIFSVHKVP